MELQQMPRKPIPVLVAMAFALLAFVAAGCGGGSDETGESTAATLTRKAFIVKGDQICKDNYSKRTKLLTEILKRYNKKGETPSQAQQEKILVERVMPIFKEESDELNSLPLPDVGAEEAKKILAELEASIEGVEENPARSLAQGTEVEFRDTEALARKYGFEWCGRS